MGETDVDQALSRIRLEAALRDGNFPLLGMLLQDVKERGQAAEIAAGLSLKYNLAPAEVTALYRGHGDKQDG